MKAERRELPAGDAMARVVRRSRAAMGLESFLRGFWPLGAGGVTLWAALAFGLPEVLSHRQFLGFAAAAALVLAVLLVRGIRRFRWPTEAAARARIDATLPGRPLAALLDSPAVGKDDPAARSVWDAHLARMRRLAAAARPVGADLRLAAHDPWGLRLVALVAAIAAAVFAHDRGIEAAAGALQPPPGTAVATGASYEGWAEPPAYTGRPTLYLPEVASGASLSVPEGTKVTLRTYGPADRFTLSETVSGAAASPAELAEAAPGIAAAEFQVAASGTVTLGERGTTLGSWSFVMEPDRPPSIDMIGTLERAASGETKLGYKAEDDHGVVRAHAEITLDLPRVDRRYGLAVEPEARPPLEADLPLPLSGNNRELDETLVEDFSKEPFAGLPVTVALTAADATGKTATSAPVSAVLPMRSFYDPMAQALVEQRRDLLWSAANGRRVTQVLKAITNHPDDAFSSPRAYLVVRSAIRSLDAATQGGQTLSAEVRDGAAEALWQAALQIEDGTLADAAQRLARAKERLQQALQDGASDEEIARLMDELRQATRNYMDQMARDAQKGQKQAQIPPGSKSMTQDQIQQLMDRIQELSEQGRKEEAQALLDMLQQLLDNMQMVMGDQNGTGTGENGQGEQSMQGLADALREQQGLADDSFQQLQRQFRGDRPGNQGEGGQPGQPGGDQADRGEQGQSDQSLAERQEALRQLMEGLQQGLPGEAGEAAREALREAERSMGEARDGLRDGDTSGAIDHQAEAIDKMREGMRQMGEDLTQAEKGRDGQQGQLGGESTAENGRDPLGRPIGGAGSTGTNRDMLPEGDSASRAKALLDEIRRRAGDLGRPQLELDYLKRLLDLF
ncbi:MAG: TIGR02302 family protein [Amaricoccus sp.]